ncbi:glutaredoxin family protein [Haladaptatus sp. DYF46]|uniref:glutaredoxin family protein n=1 Tax=Haladaptatus sp. DYF46 TaxID=2886041 RepID=UPI001E3DE6F2|nr:glutaredoxin family protein [Haladaptatus sp. DYF46]
MTFTPGEELSAEEVEERVDSTIADEDVVLFMKGTRIMPQCGFSMRAVELLDKHRGEDFETVNVLDNLDAYREALSGHSGWETIPQTYVDGEFIGGSDILAEMEERDELESTLRAD